MFSKNVFDSIHRCFKGFFASQRKGRSSLDSPRALLLLGGKHEIRKNMKHEELKKLALTR
ncbi:hypothetical protein F5ESL0236_04055 [Lactobacillus sp. ESL0236]|nr:hypothetical protein F5ESL0236_04055 [Lactobacillus sp. ESL0236]